MYANRGGCQTVCEDVAKQGNHALCKRAREEQDLRGGEWVSENGKDILSHHAREDRARHHTEKRGEVGDDRVEGEVIRSVLIGEIDVGQRGHDRSRRNAEHVLREAHDDVEPDGVSRYEGVCVIRSGMDDEYDRKGTEPIVPGDESLPHTREEDKEEEVSRVNAVAERIADADVLKNVRIERCIGEVECEGIGSGDQDRAEKALIFEGKCENIGKFRLCGCGVREFLRDEPDDAVDDRKREGDESDDDEHGKLVLRSRKRVSDCGYDQRDGERDGAVDTACGVEIVNAHVIGQEVCVPSGESRAEELVDRVRDDDQNDEPEQKHIGVRDDHRQDGDTDNADGVVGKLARHEDPFSLFEMLEQNRREEVEQTGDVGNKGQNTNARFVEPVHQKEACVKKTSRKLTDETDHDGRGEHAESASAEIVLYVIHVKQRAFPYSITEITEKTSHKDPFLPFGEMIPK